MATLLISLLLAVGIGNATTLVGNIRNPNGTGAYGTLILSLSQQAAQSGAGFCGGTSVVVPTYELRITVDNGSLFGLVTVIGNDCLAPQGTYYNVRFVDQQGNTYFTDRWIITGSTIDVGTIVSAVISGTTQTLGSTGVVLYTPTSSQTIVQPALTSFNINTFAVTTRLTLPDGSTCTSSGCAGVISNAVTLTGDQTIGGIKTFSNTPLFTPGTSLGSTAGPASVGYFSTSVLVPVLKLFTGPITAPTDYFTLETQATHFFNMVNSVGDSVLSFVDNGAFVTNSTWGFRGWIAPDGGYYQRTTTSDFNCSTLVGGQTTLRIDTTPPEFQICVGGTRYKIQLSL